MWSWLSKKRETNLCVQAIMESSALGISSHILMILLHSVEPFLTKLDLVGSRSYGSRFFRSRSWLEASVSKIDS